MSTPTTPARPARPDLKALLERLRGQAVDTTAPIQEVAPQLELLAGEDLAKVRETERAGQLLALAKGWFAACKAARAEDERQWYKDLDMYRGVQFSEWSTHFNGMVTPAAPAYEPRIAVNIIEPIVRTELAKTSQRHPTASVLPGSNDDSDKLAAIAAEQACEWFYSTSKFQTRVFNPANFWRSVTGNGFLKTYWNPDATDEAATEAAKIKHAAELKQQTEQQLPFAALAVPPGPVKGKIMTQMVTPFHLLVPDLAEVNLQEQSYVIQQYVMPYARARMIYAKYIDENWQPTKVSANSILNSAHLGIKGGNNAVVDSVLCLEVWVKPMVTELLPEGGLIIIVGEELVGLAENGIPYKHGEFPFAHITGIDSGRFYRKSTVNSVTPLQNEVNRTWNQLIKAKNLAIKPQYFYDEGSLDPRLWRSKAGTLIPIRLGMKYPTPVEYPPLPTFVVQLMDNMKATLDDISGQHQVSRAISPGADTAASALALLTETDDNFLSTTFASIEEAASSVYRQFLSLAVQFWDLPRLIKVTGEDTPFSTQLLSSAELANGTDVQVESGSALPVSKAGRIAQITEWIDKGIIPPDVGLEAMEMGTLGKVFKRLKIDRDQAMRENIMMRNTPIEMILQHQQIQQQAAAMVDQMAPVQGTDPMSGAPTGQIEPAQPDPFFPIGWMDNDEVHIQEHKDEAKGERYLSLPPELQKEWELHVMLHEQRYAQTMQAAAAMTAPADGAPGEEPGEESPDSYADSQESQSAA